MKKRVIGVLFAVVMLCGIIPIPAGATETAGIEIIAIPGNYNGLLAIDGSKTMAYSVNSSNGRLTQYESYPYFNDGLAMVAIDGKVGYIDTTGKVVVAIGEDHERTYFNDGLIPAYDPHVSRENRKYGYIDTNHDLVLPYEYDSAQPFYEGFAAVGTRTDNGTKWGFINKVGELVVPYEYTAANHFSEGLAAVTSTFTVPPQECTCVQLINGNIHYPECPSLASTTVSRFGFIDQSGNLVIPIEYQGVSGFTNPSDYAYFSEGLAPVRDSASNNRNWGYINKNGEMVISSLDYSIVFPFSDGLALVARRSDTYNGFIDKSGNLVIPCIYAAAGSFSNGFALVQDGGKCGYINKSGKVVVPLEYDYASFFNEGYAIAQKGGQWYILKATGNDTQPTQSTPSTWAAEYVERANGLNLVPATLNSAYTQATTRAEFCALAVTLYENLKGEIAERKTFTDTTDINVAKAAAIGVVAGINVEGTLFSPDSQLTREQAATMLSRLAAAVGKPLPEQAATFADNGSISSWAASQVGQVQAAGIMGGIGNNLFSPQGSYTREQSIITILRLYDVVK